VSVGEAAAEEGLMQARGEDGVMTPNPSTTRKAYEKKRQGYATSTAAGVFVEEEMHHKKQRKHGPESRKQAIAIGLSKARKAGLNVPNRPKSKRPAGSSRKKR
jgi:hypothetical protein